jgi:hypothetical protein
MMVAIVVWNVRSSVGWARRWKRDAHDGRAEGRPVTLPAGACARARDLEGICSDRQARRATRQDHSLERLLAGE